MTRPRRHPLYVAFMTLLVILCLTGLVLLVWGSVRQGALPRPMLTIPLQVHHG